jgi:hypothetical protein
VAVPGGDEEGGVLEHAGDGVEVVDRPALGEGGAVEGSMKAGTVMGWFVW